MSELSRDIEEFLDQIPYGEGQFTVKRHGKKSTKLSLYSYGEERFADNPKAVEHILRLIKKAVDTGESGNFSFTLMLKSGKIVSVIQQGYQSKDYNDGQR